MSSFTRALFEPTGRTVRGRIEWVSAEDFWFLAPSLEYGVKIFVPKGTLTDGPSIPWWLLRVVPSGCMIRSAFVHDSLRRDMRFTKLQTDVIFLVALEAEGVPRLWRWLAFFAVCLNNSRG